MKLHSLGLASRWLAFLSLYFALCSADSHATEDKPEWIRGKGESLEFRLTGEVVGAGGEEVTDFSVTCQLNAAGAEHRLNSKVDGNHFEVWIPTDRVNWHSMWIRVSSKDKRLVAYKTLVPYELRQTATKALQFQLAKQPTRVVEVNVEYLGKPVPHAHVIAELGFSINLPAVANDEGVATFHLLPEQQLVRFTAWTDDFKMGGFSFNRKPTRDPAADAFTVELNQCRDKLLRVVDDQGAPVPNLDFVLQMATLPDYNFVGTNDNSRLKTDGNGEVVYRWFPNWKERHCYMELDSKLWLPEQGHEENDDAIVFRVKKSKIADRKRVIGRISGSLPDLAGFHVQLSSFQGERERYSDALSTFTDVDGSFALDVLPDATYCAFVVDSEFVCLPIDLIPYDSSTDAINSPKLAVSKGQRVEVTVTSGPEKKPYANLTVNFSREHGFTWREDGRNHNGIGGPSWRATTDDHGLAVATAASGKLKVRIYTPLWRAEQEVDVVDGEDASVTLHRPFEEKQRVIGQLVLGDGVQADLADAQVDIGSVDGKFDDQQSIMADASGSFTFETMSTELGVFAYTKDGRAAGTVVVSSLSKPISLELRPTVAYAGQLLDEDDQPKGNQQVEASIRVEGSEDYNSMFVKSFEAKRFTAQTDSEGKYVLQGIPTNVKVNLFARVSSSSRDTEYLGEVYLEPGESRPLAINRIGISKSSSIKVSLLERFENTLRDCRLMGFNMMVITCTDETSSKAFIDRYFKDYVENKEISTYMQVVLSEADIQPASEDAAFAAKLGWKMPDHGKVFAYAIDGNGKDLGMIEIDLKAKDGAQLATAFVNAHVPDKLDAEQKWDDAFEAARLSNKRVWARISQRYCGPCFRLARWFDDHREMLEQDFVMLKIDDFRDLNGIEIAKRLTLGKHHGVPFHAIFEADESMLVDSAGNLGNIGHPSGYEGKKHMRKMLETGGKTLTPKEVDQLVDSLED